MDPIIIDVIAGPGFDGCREVVRQIKRAAWGQEVILRGTHQALALYRIMRLHMVHGVTFVHTEPCNFCS